MLRFLSALSPEQTVFLLLFAIAFAIVGTLYIQRRWQRYLGGARRKRGLRSERTAERILKKAGYRVVERQAAAQAHVIVDGTRKNTWLHADYIVTKEQRRFLVEVKTGARKAATRDRTRRQLLEYALVYDVDGILLIDAETQVIQAIGFDYEAE